MIGCSPVMTSVSDPTSLNPAKNLNLDPDPSCLTLPGINIQLVYNYKISQKKSTELNDVTFLKIKICCGDLTFKIFFGPGSGTGFGIRIQQTPKSWSGSETLVMTPQPPYTLIPPFPPSPWEMFQTPTCHRTSWTVRCRPARGRTAAKFSTYARVHSAGC